MHAASQHPEPPPHRPDATLAGRLGIDRRTVVVVLAALWIVDAALQLQPRMWTAQFVDDMVLPMAHGQPAPIAWSITQIGHFLRPDAGVWNFLFAMTQLAIGVGLLVRRTEKAALAAMMAWSFGVWWIGEGFGQLLTGTASPLTGAPGAVLLYAVIGVLVWPRRSAAPSGTVEPGPGPRRGLASSAAATGPFAVSGALAAWGALWIASAVLLLQPANRTANGISDAIRSVAPGEPGWFAHFLTTAASGLSGHGVVLAWVLAAASVAIGIGPVLSRRPAPFLVAGVAVQLAFWVTGQALGSAMTGMGTDLQAAPLVALMALAMAPTVAAARTASAADGTPLRRYLARNPLATGGVAAALGAALLLSATYPAQAAVTAQPASTSSSGGSMPGMAMPGSADASTGGPSGASTGGSATAWHYTGPALPVGETRVLTSVFDATEKGHAMQTANCTAAPTAAQSTAAIQLVQQTSAAVAKYRDLSAAVADGYIPITSTVYPVVHYVKIANLQSKYVLDPNHVQSLVYAFTPQGPVLAAAMYLMPSVGEKGPMPGGCLTQWHAHTNLCASDTTQQISGFAPCPPGMHPFPTPEMFHVWQVPVPGGPLTMDPTDLQVVEASIMAQQQGLAPVGASSGA